MHVPIFYENIHHSHLLFGRVWSRRIWLSWRKRLFILLRYNPQRSSHTDKIGKVWQCIKLQWKSRRASQNIPIILWGYLSLIPVLLWMYSRNSLLLKTCKLREACVNLWRPTGEGLFLRNLHRRTEKKRKHIGLRVKDNVILSTFHSLRVLITLGIFPNNATLTENREWLSNSLAKQILTSQNRDHDSRRRVSTTYEN